MNEKPKIDYKKLTPEQRDKLDQYEYSEKQLSKLEDLAKMLQEVIYMADEFKTASDKSSNEYGAVLLDIRESISAFNTKEMPKFPDIPDWSKPVVESVNSMKKSVDEAIRSLDMSPVIKVSPEISAPVVDTKGIEKAISKSQDKMVSALQAIPVPEFPEFPDRTDELLEILRSIDTASRMKPQPGSMAISNLADTPGLTDAELRATPVDVSVVSDTYSAVAVDATLSGNNTIVAITNTARLYYVSLSANGANSADVTAIVKIGTSEKFKVSLKAGSIFARNIGAGRRYLTGSSGDDIIVNLSAAQTVHVSVEYEDI